VIGGIEEYFCPLLFVWPFENCRKEVRSQKPEARRKGGDGSR
jgi:hypothetical protein